METEKKPKDSKFKLGQKVQLKTGGDYMLIDSFDEDGRVVCVWWEQSPNPPYASNFRSHAFLEGNLCESVYKLREEQMEGKGISQF